MDSKVHPLVIVLVILVAVLSIGIWTWGSGEARKIGGPAGLTLDPRGHLFIQIQNQLLEHNADGEFVIRHDLARIDVEHVVGAIDFFSNGDMLIRRGPDTRTLGDNIRAFLRRTNNRSLTPQTPDTGLYRCNPDSAQCVLFGTTPIDFKSAHGLFIDRRTDDVYITDTTRHLLRKYSSAGEQLANPVAGFKFPNHVVLHEDQLFIADTNNHRVRVVDPGSDSFGEEFNSIDVVPEDARRGGQIWPTHIVRIADHWWINNMRSAMNEGGIYIFDTNWRYLRKVDLPGGADPISLVPFQDNVLVSDWNNDRIYRISTAGDLLVEFSSSGFEQVLSESRQARMHFEMVSYGGIAVFILMTAGLLVRGLAVMLSGKNQSR